MSEGIRIYLTGTCEGFEKLRDALAQQPGIEVVGSSDQPSVAAAALQGGHLDCVLHATSSSTLPAHEIATILAAALAKADGRRTLLLDLDLQFGDAAIMLGIEPEKTIFDFVNAPGELDPDKLAGYTTTHKSGLDILPAPLRPEDAELVTEAKLGRLLEVARDSYDVIVVDTSPFFHGPMLATLDRTDELLMLCGLDVPTLKNVRLSLQTLDLLSFPTARIRFVLNRANSKVGMSKKEVEGALDMKVAFEIPSDRAVPVSVNRGNPAVLGDGGSEFSGAIKRLAQGLVIPTRAAAKKAKKGLFSLAKA